MVGMNIQTNHYTQRNSGKDDPDNKAVCNASGGRTVGSGRVATIIE